MQLATIVAYQETKGNYNTFFNVFALIPFVAYQETKENYKLLAKRGRGFVRITDVMVEGRKYPMKVKILTDECCCSAGEYFVELASKSPKVTVMGRPTMGIQDYSNCTNAIWDTFYLAYPTSRDCRIDLGQGLLGRGVPVDEYIRWTPEFLGDNNVINSEYTCRNFECDL